MAQQMENKYFTPDIEDICVGYEYEQLINQVWTKEVFAKGSYLPENIDLLNWIHSCVLSKKIRVPYLTKEQIEAEGWELQNVLLEDDDGNDMFSTGFVKSIDEYHWYELVLQKDNKIFIQYKWYRNSVAQLCRTVYYGKCKDINTFRKICKLLEI